MNKVLLCCCAKCENRYIREWVEANLSLGFAGIVIYDNNDPDGERFEEVISDYMSSGQVRVEDWRGRQKIQLKCYRDCLKRFSPDYDWTAFFDCDEFLVFPGGGKVGDFLAGREFDGYDVVRVNWRVYDDNALLYYDDRPVRERFTHPMPCSEIPDGFNINFHVKSIVRRGAKVDWKGCTPHFPKRLSSKVKACDVLGHLAEGNSPFGLYNFSRAYLAHYSYKTVEEYIGLKKKRGFPDRRHNGDRVNLATFFGVNEFSLARQAVGEECFATGQFPIRRDSKRFLVHLHLYYLDQLEYFISKLKNIQLVEWDLYVTGNNLGTDIKERIRAFKSDVVFVDVPNVGYDIWPFIRVLKEVDLDKYDVVLKLHTKGPAKRSCTVAGFRIKGLSWRNEMVDCLLEDIGRFRSLSRYFDNPRTGIVCSFPLYKQLTDYLWEDVCTASEMARYGLSTGNSRFVAGSIFALRASSLQFLKDAPLRQEDFESGNSSHFSGTPAHIYERVISLAPTAQGLEAVTVELSSCTSFFVRLRRALQPFGENLFSLRREGANRKKYLRILFLRVKVSD